MQIARVIGTVVATVKNATLEGREIPDRANPGRRP